MKEKLSKNDSITAKKTNLDEVLAKFEELLVNRNLWSRYMINFARSYQISNSEGIYTYWKKWALETPPYKWIAEAFIWRETLESRYTWTELDYSWLIWICENIDK